MNQAEREQLVVDAINGGAQTVTAIVEITRKRRGFISEIVTEMRKVGLIEFGPLVHDDKRPKKRSKKLILSGKPRKEPAPKLAAAGRTWRGQLLAAELERRARGESTPTCGRRADRALNRVVSL